METVFESAGPAGPAGAASVASRAPSAPGARFPGGFPAACTDVSVLASSSGVLGPFTESGILQGDRAPFPSNQQQELQVEGLGVHPGWQYFEASQLEKGALTAGAAEPVSRGLKKDNDTTNKKSPAPAVL